jgi:uncharacterized protein DUF928
MIHRLVMLPFTRNGSGESGKEGAVRTLIGLMLIIGTALAIALSGSGPIDAAEEQAVLAQAGQSEEAQFPVYKPPKKGTPRARVGGTLRGSDGTDPVIVPLVPDHVGFTVKQTPTLNWFLSKPTTYPIHFTFNSDQTIRPVYEGTLPTPKQEGVQSIDLKTLGINLEPNVQYRWFVSARRNPNSYSEDIVGGGMIERCEFADCVIEKNIVLTCDQQSIRQNVVNGLWYDAMACLCSLIEAKPADSSLRRLRADLLKQVGLYEVAEWDLRSIQSALQ